METTPAQPLSPHQRTPIVDILRGWALLGVAIGNFGAFHTPGSGIEPGTLDLVTRYLFSAKSWTLLSILFGYGFSLLIAKVADATGRPVSFFLKRMFWLLTLAFVNSLFFYGDILRDYALLGMLLLLFHRSSTKRVLFTSILLMLVVPFVSAYIRSLGISHQAEVDALLPAFQSRDWLDIFQFNLQKTFLTEVLDPNYAITVHVVMFACMLLGVAAHRSGFPRQLATRQRLVKQIFWTSLAAAVALNAVFWHLNETNAPLLNYFRFGYWGVISTMFAIASGICWWYHSGRLRSLWPYLQAMGRMTLTNYMTQCVLLALIFSGAGLHVPGTMPYGFYVLLAIGIYILQLFASRWWLSNFQYGPVEWLWRKQSYGFGIPSMKKEKVFAQAEER